MGVEEEGLAKTCGLIDYGDYEPKEVDRLSQLPEAVRFSLLKHVRSRIGDAAFSRLLFEGGQVVDKKRLYRDEPDAKDYEWTIPTYELHFMFVMTEHPVVRYCAEIELDEAGGVIKEIDLPRYSKSPEKLRIVPVAKALDVAATKGVPADKAFVDAGYAAEFDNLEWLVSYSTPREPTGFTVTTLHLVAHDPDKYRWSQTDGDF